MQKQIFTTISEFASHVPISLCSAEDITELILCLCVSKFSYSILWTYVDLKGTILVQFNVNFEDEAGL